MFTNKFAVCYNVKFVLKFNLKET